MSNHASLCAECGTVRQAGALRALCPRCVMRVALDRVGPDEEALITELEPTSPDGKRFGDYLLLNEIGRGGTGVVFEARELSLQRVVALKMLLPGRLATPSQLERFRMEAEAIAALDHPNLLPVYSTGRIGSQPYFTMKRAEGGSLSAHLRSREAGLTPRESARLVADVARAVHYAHQRGIHHRDLKPANILLDASGHPFVGDFGLAKFKEYETHLTQSADIFGSPAYMSPEQASGETRRVTASTDIYSLGVILYELLAGRIPFRADSTAALLRAIAEEEPIPPRLIRPAIPVDLEVICLKCLQKEPEKRLLSAEFLADELDRWARGESILSRPATSLEKMERWVRRKPALALALGLLLLTFSTGVGAVFYEWRRTIEVSRQRLLERYAADLQVASVALANHDLGLARRMVASQLPKPGEEDLRGPEWHWLASLTKGNDRLKLVGHTATVTSVAVFPGGRKIVSGGMDGMLRIWDASTGACLTNFPAHVPVVWTISIATNGELVTAGADGHVRFWTDGGKPTGSPIPGTSAALSADGSLLAVSASPPFKYHPGSPGLKLINRHTGRTLFESPAIARRLALSRDGSYLAAATDDGILLVDVKTGIPRRLSSGIPWSLSFSPDGQRLAAAGFGLGALVWNLSSGGEPLPLRGHNYQVWDAAFSPDGRSVATTGADRTLRIHPLFPVADAVVLEGHDDEVWSVAWFPDGQSLATSGKDMTVRTWPLRPQPKWIEVSNLNYWRPVFSLDGQHCLTSEAGANGVRTMVLRTTATGETVARFKGRWDGTFAPDGQQLLLVGDDQSVLEQWDPGTPKINRLVHLSQVPTGSRAANFIFSNDGTTVAGVYPDGTRLWRTSDGSLLSSALPLPGNGIVSGAVSSHGRFLALSAEDPYTVFLYNLENGRRFSLTNHTEIVKGLSFSPDGRSLATASVDGFIRLWETRSGHPIAELARHLEEATDVAFSGDGRTLASIGIAQGVKFWHLPTLRQVVSQDIPDAGDRIAFSPMNDAVIFSSLSNTARILNIGRNPAER
ncbi:MAG TPA: serine/threonine-protein kinase [Candidatus Limnocylindria bacterium]|nr:serine/threonine-protein kinase [Candidatus Limnocylindria bacterium]